MAHFYADENFHRRVVEYLRHFGHDVLTVQEAGQQGGDDVQVLAFATGLGRAVLTFNRRHFARLHLQMPAHAGIVVCTRDDPLVLAQRIDQTVAGYPQLTNQLIRVNKPP